MLRNPKPGAWPLVRQIRHAERAVGLGLVAALAALAVCVLVLEPVRGVTIDGDAATSVLYFRYLLSGHRLEAFVDTVPKPLLTIVYGTTWQLTHDWRALTWETIAVFVVAVSSAAVLARRLAGPVAAGFIVAGLLAWPDMLTQVAHANAMPWAVAGWFVAGLALTGKQPRPWLAGTALLLAGLARLETIWLVLVGVVGVAFLVFQARRTGRWDLVRSATLTTGLAALAFPVTGLHDWLLTGTPLYSLAVQAGYTAVTYPGLKAIGLRAFWSQVVWYHYSGQVPWLLLAFAGMFKLARRRPWLILAALVAVPAGVAVTLALLAHRGIYISDRYWEEADVSFLFAAAVGSAWLVERTLDWLRSWSRAASPLRRIRAPVLLGSGGLIALALAASALSTGSIQDALAATRTTHADVARVSSQLTAIARGTTGDVTVVPGVVLPVAKVSAVRLYVPREDVARVAVEADVPYAAVGDNYLAFRGALPPNVLQPGQWVFHDAGAEAGQVDLGSLEVDIPTPIGHIVVVPVVADPQSGVWVLRIDATRP